MFVGALLMLTTLLDNGVFAQYVVHFVKGANSIDLPGSCLAGATLAALTFITSPVCLLSLLIASARRRCAFQRRVPRWCMHTITTPPPSTYV